jgi:hypothetical protein
VNASEKCATIENDQERLECYDSLYQPKKITDLIISLDKVTQTAISNTISEPKIKNKPKPVSKIKELFSTSKTKEQSKPKKEILDYYVITKIRLTPDGKYIIYSQDLKFRLAEYTRKSFKPKPGLKFTIRESNFGGFRIKFEGLNKEYRIKS